MAFIPCPGILQLDARYLWQGERCENSYHVDNGSGAHWSQADMLTITTALGGWDLAHLVSGVSANRILTSIHARDLTDANSAERDDTYAQPGTATGTDLPNNVTIAIKWATGKAGRSFRGRTYHLGMLENQVANNRIVSAEFTFLTNAYLALISAISGTGKGTLVVLSRFSGVDSNGKPIPRSAGLSTPITSVALADDTVDSQRRRLPGHNRHR